MGLFVAKDGHYQGWLATLMCCTSIDADDYYTDRTSPRRKSALPGFPIANPQLTGSKAITQAGSAICYEQPLPLRNLAPARVSTLPVLRPVESGDQYIRPQDRVRSVSERPPSIKPFEFSQSPLLGRNRTSYLSRQRDSPNHSARPSISNPTDFRRLDLTEGQRHSLVPLRLGPVVLNPGVGEHDISRSCPPTASSTEFKDGNVFGCHLDSRDTSAHRWSRNSQIFLPDSPPVTTPDRAVTKWPIREDVSGGRPPLSTQSSSSSIRSMRRYAADAPSSTTPSRPSSDLTLSSASSIRSFRRHIADASAATTPLRQIPRLNRKRSSQSARKSTAESIDWDIDREILELNTIVEERRAEAARSTSPEAKHVPAIAPAMAGRARSETLNDIGSAFSRPLLAGALPVVMTKRLSRPFTAMPETHGQQFHQESISKSDGRISGWLADQLGSPSASINSESIRSHTLSDRRRTASDSSLLSSAMDSRPNSLIAASSPTSKSHSRSLTAESRMTATSPLARVSEDFGSGDRVSTPRREHWSTNVYAKAPVGLAI